MIFKCKSCLPKMSGYFFIPHLFFSQSIFYFFQIACLSTFMQLSSLLQAIKHSKITSLYHLQQALSKIVTFIQKSFVAIHLWSCINCFIDFPAKSFNHLHQMVCFLLLETQKLEQLIVAHFSNARTVKVESAAVQGKFRSLLEEVQILEDATQRGANMAHNVWSFFFAVLQQVCYLESFILCSVILQESCLKFVKKFRKSFQAIFILDDKIRGALIEDLQTDVFLVSNLKEYLCKSPHEKPDSITQLYGRQHRTIETIFSICFKQRANLQLSFLPILVIILENDIVSEPRLEKQAEIDHSLSQSWFRQAIFVGLHLIKIKLLVVVRECSHRHDFILILSFWRESFLVEGHFPKLFCVLFREANTDEIIQKIATLEKILRQRGVLTNFAQIKSLCLSVIVNVFESFFLCLEGGQLHVFFEKEKDVLKLFLHKIVFTPFKKHSLPAIILQFS